MNEQQQDWIDRFLRNEMTAEERKTFETQLQEDTGLKEQFDFTKMVQTAIKSRNEKLACIRRWDNEDKRKDRHRAILRAIGATGLVAAAVIGIILFIPLNRFRELPIVNMVNMEHYRGQKAIGHIAELVHEKKYKEALERIEAEERAASRSFQLCPDYSHQQTNKKGASPSVDRQDAEELLWLKAHALAGLGRMKDALECLDRIRRAEGVYKDKADSLFRCWK